jgi:hypothetical protein
MATKTVHVPDASFSGNELFALTIAYLRVLGMTGKKPVARRASTICAIYASNSMLRHHAKNGLFEKTDDGYVLTDKGRAHFSDRLDPKVTKQNADPKLVRALETVLRKGGSACGATFKPVTVKV